MKIAIASDHAGFELKEQIKREFAPLNWIDLGTDSSSVPVDYPYFGIAIGNALTAGLADRGVVICGSGVGISIAANRFRAVRAALCTEVTMARLGRLHNDANVLALGSRIVGFEVARECVDAFISTAFEGGRHERRISMLSQ